MLATSPHMRLISRSVKAPKRTHHSQLDAATVCCRSNPLQLISTILKYWLAYLAKSDSV
jgi:hypothetical protein